MSSVIPESVPRPAAKILVGFVGFSVATFLLKSILSTALTLLLVACGGVYFLTRDGEGGEGETGNDTLDEARRIMDKYK